MANTLLQYLTTQKEETRNKMREILDKADEEGRPVSDEEKAEIQALTERFKEVSAKRDAEVDKINMRRYVDEAIGVPEEPIEQGPTGGSSLGDSFVRSTAWKAIKTAVKEGRVHKGVSLPSTTIQLGTKAAQSPVLESNNTPLFGTGGNAGAISTVLPGVSTPGFTFLQPVIADLVPSITVTEGNSVTLRIVANRDQLTNSSATQVEGSSKQTVGYEFDVVSKVLETKAGIVEFSMQLAEDDAAVRGYIDTDLPFQLRQAEEEYLAGVLYDSVSDATPLSGATTGFDAIMSAVSAIRKNGFTPTGIVIDPDDWAALVIEKFAGGTAQYVGGGPFAPMPNDPWGVRWVISSEAVSNHPLVGDFARGAKVYRKGGINMATDTSGERFDKNLIAIRAEMREVANQEYPDAFATADLSGLGS